VSDWWARDGGVSEPLVGVWPWLRLSSLEVSVDSSALKLALERRRNSLNFRNEGAMACRGRTERYLEDAECQSAAAQDGGQKSCSGFRREEEEDGTNPRAAAVTGRRLRKARCVA